MTRHAFIFLGTFLVGALGALLARTATHQPHAEHTAAAVGGGDYAPLVANTPPAPSSAHADHAPAATTARPSPLASRPPAPGAPVNTVCAICGMPVDPKLPTAEYQGQTIGFGCRMCPPKFQAEPDKYGPLYLRNEVLKR